MSTGQGGAAGSVDTDAMVCECQVRRGHGTLHMARETILLLRALASRSRFHRLRMTRQAFGAVECSVVAASILVRIVAREAGEVLADEESAAGHQSVGLVAHRQRILEFGSR